MECLLVWGTLGRVLRTEFWGSTFGLLDLCAVLIVCCGICVWFSFFGFVW